MMEEARAIARVVLDGSVRDAPAELEKCYRVHRIVDPRIEEALSSIRRAIVQLDRLDAGVDPEFDSALAGFRKRMADQEDSPPAD